MRRVGVKEVLDSFKPPNWQRAKARFVILGKGRVRSQDLGHRSGTCCQLRYSPRSIRCTFHGRSVARNNAARCVNAMAAIKRFAGTGSVDWCVEASGPAAAAAMGCRVPVAACKARGVGRGGAGGRFAFIDFSAGPFEWGPIVGGKGVRTARTIPDIAALECAPPLSVRYARTKPHQIRTHKPSPKIPPTSPRSSAAPFSSLKPLSRRACSHRQVL